MKRLVVSNLGQGSAFGKKGENNRLGRKKNRRAKRAERGEGERGESEEGKGRSFPLPQATARFASLSYLTLFFAFFPQLRSVVPPGLHTFKLALTVSL